MGFVFVRPGQNNLSRAHGTVVRSHEFSEHLVAEHGNVGFARRQAMLREQFSNGAVRGPFLLQLRDDFFRRKEVLEFLRTPWGKFRDRFGDGVAGSKADMRRIDSDRNGESQRR